MKKNDDLICLYRCISRPMRLRRTVFAGLGFALSSVITLLHIQGLKLTPKTSLALREIWMMQNHIITAERPSLQERRAMWAQGEAAAWSRRIRTGEVYTNGKAPLRLCLPMNASRICIEAALQVRDTFRVYLVPCHEQRGWRFQQVMYSALRQHPYIRQVSTPEEADLLFWIPTCATSFNPQSTLRPEDYRRLAVLEESDKPGNWNQINKIDRILAYMKRSWVDKANGTHTSSKRSSRNADTETAVFLPLPYSVWDNYTLGLSLGAPRYYDIVSTVRTHATIQPARTRVLQWLTDAASTTFNHTNIYLGDTGGHRKTVQSTYFELMRNARIVVTCNPSAWDGDYRTYEALATGALVFVDELHTPAPYPLVDGVHLIVYNSHDKEDFLAKLDFYLHRPDLAAAIAANGLYHVLKYHRAISRIDYVLRSLHLRLLEDALPGTPRLPSPSFYSETAIDIRDSAQHETHRLLPWNPPDSLAGAILP